MMNSSNMKSISRTVLRSSIHMGKLHNSKIGIRSLTIISSRNLHWNVEHVPHFTKSGRVYPQAFSKLQFSTYPGHTLVPMPSLSPTMETGSIAKWLLKEGDKFTAGTAICEVETDKATVTYEATEDGYIAKILVGTGEVKVGQPLMVTVEDPESIPSFGSYSVEAAVAPAVAAAAPSSVPAPSPSVASVAASAPVAAAAVTSAGSRIFASPLAKKLARESGITLGHIPGSGPNGRIVAADVLNAPKVTATAISSGSVAAAPTAATTASAAPAKLSLGAVPGVYQDFELSDLARAVAARQTASKQQVPHYYLSVELDLTKLLKLRAELNAGEKDGGGLSVQDFLVKASALAMKQVPDVNGSWLETFVRRYEQVDINVVMGSGAGLLTPVVRDVGAKGLKAVSQELAELEVAVSTDGASIAAAKVAPGTFSIYNLGIYGIKSSAPIVLPPQACALSLGAIVDTVVPAPDAKDGEDNWKVAPILTATLSCDHRVVDGAVGAQWLAAFRLLVENPITMML